MFDPFVFTVVLVGWIFSLCLHEFAHALVAYYGGDKSVKDKGYLTFNPLRYTDPVSSLVWPLLLLAIGGIGLPGGAVYIDNSRLRSRLWDCGVSLAGPLSNALLLALLLVPFWLGLVDLRDPGDFWLGYTFVCYLQVMAVFFNLLPVPPLDGFQAIGAYLKPRTRAWFNAQGGIFLLALIVLLWRVDTVAYWFWHVIDTTAATVGVPVDLADEAWPKVRLPLARWFRL